MRVVVTRQPEGWYGEVFVDGAAVWKTKAERRMGCAFRSATLYIEGVYGRPAGDTFVIDLGEW